MKKHPVWSLGIFFQTGLPYSSSFLDTYPIATPTQPCSALVCLRVRLVRGMKRPEAALNPSYLFSSFAFSSLLLPVSISIPPLPQWRFHCLCNVSKHLCSIRGSQACQNWAKRPSVHPIEVGQMAVLIPRLVNCLWQERWHIRSWTRAVLAKALQTVVDTVACTLISGMFIAETIKHPTLIMSAFLFNCWLKISVHWLKILGKVCTHCKCTITSLHLWSRLWLTYNKGYQISTLDRPSQCKRRWPGVVF